MKKTAYSPPGMLKSRLENSRKEFELLVRKMKKLKPDKLDEMIHALHSEAFARFDCLECANCCKTIGPLLIPSDAERLARHLKMKIADFHKIYTTSDEDNDLVFNTHPCPFLMSDNYCSVYESRPRACREYPHTDRKRFYQILNLSLENCKTCPVVFSIFEELSKTIM